MQNTYLPARPDSFSAPPAPKSHTWRNVILGALGMFVALGIIGSVLDLGEPGTRVAPAPIVIDQGPIEIVEPDSGLTYEEAVDQAIPLMLQSAREIEAITATSAISSDVRHLSNAADLTEEAATLFEGVDDEIAALLHSASGHLQTAADFVAEGRWGAATQELNAYSDDIDAATTALPDTITSD